MLMNRRQFVVSAATLVATLGLGGTFAFAEDKAPEAFKLDGPFVLGFDQDFPPYGYVGDDGEFAGFDIDMAKLVCAKEGWELKLEPIAWDAKDALLNSGQITCIWNGFTIEGRADAYAFTAPYMENRQVIVVKADSGIKTFADLAGKIVITQADSAALNLLGEEGDQADLGKTFAELQTIGEYNTAFMMLEMGAVDAVALDYPVAVFQIGEKTDVYAILEEALNSEHFGVGFALGNEALAARVEADLLEIAADGKTVEELCKKYDIDPLAWCLGKAGLKDGEFVGTGKGIGGKFDVTVVVKDGKVAEVKVGDNSETAGIGTKAIEKLPAAIVEANGTEGVEAISGASITSKAILNAVEAALEGAAA